MPGIRPDAGLGLVDSEFVNGLSSGQNQLAQGTRTGNAGGGQAGATQISPQAAMVRLSTVATAGDSFKLPFASEAGVAKLVVNDTANSADIYAKNGTNRKTGSSDTINALANGTAYALAAGKSMLVFCPYPGKWFTILSA